MLAPADYAARQDQPELSLPGPPTGIRPTAARPDVAGVVVSAPPVPAVALATLLLLRNPAVLDELEVLLGLGERGLRVLDPPLRTLALVLLVRLPRGSRDGIREIGQRRVVGALRRDLLGGVLLQQEGIGLGTIRACVSSPSIGSWPAAASPTSGSMGGMVEQSPAGRPDRRCVTRTPDRGRPALRDARVA